MEFGYTASSNVLVMHTDVYLQCERKGSAKQDILVLIVCLC